MYTSLSSFNYCSLQKQLPSQNSTTDPNTLISSKTAVRNTNSESDETYGQVWWPILGICALHLTHPKCTHTAVNTHTHHEHTPGAVGSHLCRGAVGDSVPCSRASRPGIEGGERALYIPHLQFLPDRESNSQPFDYESDCITISLCITIITTTPPHHHHTHTHTHTLTL